MVNPVNPEYDPGIKDNPEYSLNSLTEINEDDELSDELSHELSWILEETKFNDVTPNAGEAMVNPQVSAVEQQVPAVEQHKLDFGWMMYFDLLCRHEGTITQSG